ncbi:glycoside hydrolase family 10 protein [Raineya orbicola]|uniref:Putative BCR n=1 Tax=Raineya orbicola TaxID=2016530 RepID=A0A2N3IE93_9BACT|nr:family 10 glycosylhydrolase [Raineya orbicola]PKQ68626.1 putative BCR [Raineya orbicola]
MLKKSLFVFFLLMFGATIFAQKNLYPRTEMRAVWVTTVANIDFPSRKGLSAEEQKKEFINILEKCKQLNFNAIIVQVRPAADALYESSFELWSEVLQGKQGIAPDYDPLAFMIEESRKRLLEFHAWVNPFRAIANINFSHIHPEHITRKRPEWFFRYGDRVYFNPGIPEVREYLLQVILEIVRKYDIDGLHFDDYFYPYPIAGEKINDDNTFDKFGKDFRNIEDWRRNNIDLFVQAVSDSIRAIKPKMKFGISPAGGWRNKNKDSRGSATNLGQPAYDNVFADTRKWLEQGWVDYLSPQTYWTIASPQASFKVLAEWWNENNFGRHIYSGHALFKIANSEEKDNWNDSQEILRQIRLSRSLKNVRGSMFFSLKHLLRNPLKICDSLQNSVFRFPALVPAMPWKDSIPPLPPDSLKANVFHNNVLLYWQSPQAAPDNEKPDYYVVFRFQNEMEINFEDASKIVAILRENYFLDKNLEQNRRYIYAIKSFDRLHNESKQYAKVTIATVKKLTMASPIKDGEIRED